MYGGWGGTGRKRGVFSTSVLAGAAQADSSGRCDFESFASLLETSAWLNISVSL